MLTDEVKIKIMAGKGGDGIVTFDKVKMSLGPTGGRGGNGGNVYFEGTSNLAALNKYRGKREWWAEDGKQGKGNRSDGQEGKDLFLTVPVGTVAHNLDTQEDIEIMEPGQKIMAAEGGLGGRGNFYFRGPKNTTPKKAEEGKPGQQFNFLLELRLIADMGLIGLPNAGKSSLLNVLTKADIKVANYPFTTLEPNLGVFEGKILADIPGLIEGASAGKGLGIKFLKHIQRTKVLAHCLSLESDDIVRDYKVLWHELNNFNPEMSKKKEIIILTKADLLNSQNISEKIKEIKKMLDQKGKKTKTFFVSIYDQKSLQNLKENIKSELKSKKVETGKIM